MEHIADNETFLKATTVAHPKQGKALLATEKQSQLDSLCEILLKIVEGVIHLPSDLIKQASRHKNTIQKIVTKYFNRKDRRELMVKYFRIVQKLLIAALPVIGVIISGAQLAATFV